MLLPPSPLLITKQLPDAAPVLLAIMVFSTVRLQPPDGHGPPPGTSTTAPSRAEELNAIVDFRIVMNSTARIAPPWPVVAVLWVMVLFVSEKSTPVPLARRQPSPRTRCHSLQPEPKA